MHRRSGLRSTNAQYSKYLLRGVGKPAIPDPQVTSGPLFPRANPAGPSRVAGRVAPRSGPLASCSPGAGRSRTSGSPWPPACATSLAGKRGWRVPRERAPMAHAHELDGKGHLARRQAPATIRVRPILCRCRRRCRCRQLRLLLLQAAAARASLSPARSRGPQQRSEAGAARPGRGAARGRRAAWWCRRS